MRAMCLIAVAAVTVGLTGCGGGGPDGATKDLIASMNDLADALTAGDLAKAKKAAAAMKASKEKLESLKLSADDKKALEEKYKEQIAAAGMKMFGAMVTSKLSPADMDELEKVMGKK